MNYVDRQKTTFSKSHSNIYLSREELEKMVPIEKINEILKTNNFKQVEEGEKNENRNSIKPNTYNIVKIENKLNLFISTNGIEGTPVEGVHFSYRTNKPDLKEFEEEFSNSKDNQIIEKFALGDMVQERQKKLEEMQKNKNELEEQIQSKIINQLNSIDDEIEVLENKLKEYGIESYYENGGFKEKKLDEQIKTMRESNHNEYKKLDDDMNGNLDEIPTQIRQLHEKYEKIENVEVIDDENGYPVLYDKIKGLEYKNTENISYFDKDLIDLQELKQEIKLEKNELKDVFEDPIYYNNSVKNILLSQIDSEKFENLKNILEVQPEIFIDYKKDNKYWEYMESKGIKLVEINSNISEKEKDFLKEYISKEKTNYQNPQEKFKNLINNIKERIPTNKKKDELLIEEIGDKDFIDIEKISKKINVSKKSIKRKVGKDKSKEKEDDLEL